MSAEGQSRPIVSPGASVDGASGGDRSERNAALAWARANKRIALVAIVLVGLASATVIQSFSWNQTSHYDLIRSLNQEKTTIDQYQANTGDKAYYKGHYYSARVDGRPCRSAQPSG